MSTIDIGKLPGALKLLAKIRDVSMSSEVREVISLFFDSIGYTQEPEVDLDAIEKRLKADGQKLLNGLREQRYGGIGAEACANPEEEIKRMVVEQRRWR